ncbi:MAG: TonB-dependent receptor [Pyrinomonadaceae bacterium]|nr:TonB-dependent receptor [Pyrinomonadaceae bacterium]
MNTHSKHQSAAGSSLILFVLLYAFTLFSTVSAQTSFNGFIVGQITGRTSGQPISGAKISVENKRETTSDAEGKYLLEIESGSYDVRIAAQGFASIVKNQIGVTGKRNTVLDVQLDITIRETVEVRSEIFAENTEQTVSNTTLNREEIRQTPGSGGDPLRVINSLPAVSAASGEFADLIVRGGSAEENLTFIDNIPVQDFTYFTDKYDGTRGGRAAILAPDIFERAEFSAGGFGVRYGDKMSSALDISLREANRKKIQAVIFADSGTAGGSVDVPFGKRGSWLFSARRSYIDVALDVAGIAEQGIIGYPRTFDFTNKFIFDFTSRHKLSVSVLNFFEDFKQTDEQASNIDRRTDRFRLKRTSRRLVAGATLSSTFGTKTLAQTTVWATGAHNDGTFFLPFTNLLQRSRDLRDSNIGIKEEATSAVSRSLQIAFGGGVYFDQADYSTFENSGRFYSPLEEEFNRAPRTNRLNLDPKTSAYAYAQATWRITPRFSVTPGIRLDRYGITQETLASPRFSARFNATSKIAFTFATGVYRQPPSLFVLSLTPNNRHLKTPTATHFIGGIEWLAREDWRVRVEAYQKNYENLIVQPLLPTQNFSLNGNHFNTGSGTAKGFEISVQKALTGFFSGQASYSFTHSRRKFTENGIEFPSDFERPHQLTLIGITRFYGFSVAAKYRIASGLPFTRRTPLEIFPNSFVYLQRVAQESDINALRLSNFASLDGRAEKRFGFKKWSFAPYIDYFNITNHNSVVQPNYEFYQPTPQFLSENQRLPIFGLRIEF